MKTIGVLAMCLAAWACSAQRYQPKPDDFRIVDGVLYNSALSTNWVNISPGRDLVVVDVLSNGVVMQEQWTEYIYGRAEVNHLERVGFGSGNGPVYRPIIGSKKREGVEVFIKNYPFKLVNGDRVASWGAMRAGETNWSGKVIRVFDCGLPNTEENRRTLKR